MLLAHNFLRRFSLDQRRGNLTFTEEAIAAIEAHRWTGNVRELLNVIRRGVIMGESNRLSASDLGLSATAGSKAEADSLGLDIDLRRVREAAERQAILLALARTDGNVAKAAEMLGISRPTLYDLMNRLAIR